RPAFHREPAGQERRGAPPHRPGRRQPAAADRPASRWRDQPGDREAGARCRRRPAGRRDRDLHGRPRRLRRQYPPAALRPLMATSALARRSSGEGRRQPRRSRRLPAELLLQRFLYSLRGLLFRSPFYRLGGPADGPGPAAVTGADRWAGKAGLGEAIAIDHFTFAGQTIRNPTPLWAPLGASPAWLAELHGFAWLRHLRAYGGDNGRRAARVLVQ